MCNLLKNALLRESRSKVLVSTEINGLRAYERLATESFDIVISDFRLRGIDGVTLLARAQLANPLGCRILISGYHELPTTRDLLAAANLDVYLQKPINITAFREVLQKVLSGEHDTLEALRAETRERERTLVLERPSPGALSRRLPD